MENKEELNKRIVSALDRIRPYLQADGGDISFVELTDTMDVKVKLLGACGTCEMSVQTLKAGVEQTIKRAIPEINEVVAV